MDSRNQNTRTRHREGAPERQAAHRRDVAAEKHAARRRNAEPLTRRTRSGKKHRKGRRAGKWRLAAVLFLALFMIIFFAGKSSDQSHQQRSEEELEMDAIFAVEFLGQGWSSWMPDNYAVYRTSTYPTAFKASIQRQTEGMTGTIQYQANVSGYGWTETMENGQVAHVDGVSAPLEGIRVWVNGDLADHYDVYTKVMVDGEWIAWAVNGNDAGIIGQGKRIEGIRIAIVKKGQTPAPITDEEIEDEEEWKTTGLNPALPMVALTFDDGPGIYEDRLLDALEAAGGKATFFMVGTEVEKYPDAVRRMAEMGCELGNHSWNHDNLSELSDAGIRETIQKTNDAIMKVCGSPSTVVRPPYGSTRNSTLPTLGSMGYSAILWSLDTEDWKHKKDPNATVQAVLSQVKDGDIILMHSIHQASVEALETIAPELRARGYQLVTVSELARAKGVTMEPGKRYGRFD